MAVGPRFLISCSAPGHPPAGERSLLDSAARSRAGRRLSAVHKTTNIGYHRFRLLSSRKLHSLLELSLPAEVALREREVVGASTPQARRGSCPPAPPGCSEQPESGALSCAPARSRALINGVKYQFDTCKSGSDTVVYIYVSPAL